MNEISYGICKMQIQILPNSEQPIFIKKILKTINVYKIKLNYFKKLLLSD